MSKSFGEEFKRKLINNKILREEWIEGCDKQVINNLMQQQDVKRLPKVYYEFLLAQGKDGLGLGTAYLERKRA